MGREHPKQSSREGRDQKAKHTRNLNQKATSAAPSRTTCSRLFSTAGIPGRTPPNPRPGDEPAHHHKHAASLTPSPVEDFQRCMRNYAHKVPVLPRTRARPAKREVMMPFARKRPARFSAQWHVTGSRLRSLIGRSWCWVSSWLRRRQAAPLSQDK